MLIAAPKILGELKTIKDVPNTADYTLLGYRFKISDEMVKDSVYTEFLFNDQHSFLWRSCTQAGIDLNKPFEFQIGFEEDDFTRNLKTGVIIQRIPV